MRYIKPRQNAVLRHSELIVEQMRRVDRASRRWMMREVGSALEERTERSQRRGRPRPQLDAWRIRSATRMYEMAVKDLSCEPPPSNGAIVL